MAAWAGKKYVFNFRTHSHKCFFLREIDLMMLSGVTDLFHLLISFIVVCIQIILFMIFVYVRPASYGSFYPLY